MGPSITQCCIYKVFIDVRGCCTHLLGNEERDSPETILNEDIFLHGNKRCHQSRQLKHLHRGSKQNPSCSNLGCTAWRGGSALGYSIPACRVYKKRVQPQRQTLDWAKALKMGTSFSSSMWSAEQSATLRMWIGSSRMFWQQNSTVNPGQQHHCCPSTTWEYQQQLHAHLGILLIVGGGLCLAEEPAV